MIVKSNEKLLQCSIVDLKCELELKSTEISELEIQIKAANSRWQEFAEVLEGIPSSVASELAKEESVLMKLYSSGNATQAKLVLLVKTYSKTNFPRIHEVIATIGTLVETSVELSPGLKKGLDDLFTK